jgi:predicted NBD/HSP70 family sugar kinase
MRGGPSQEEIRRHNLGTLLRYVHVRGPTSRAELTQALGLNRSTIGALTADLTAAGLVSEGLPLDRGRAGRPSLVVHARPERAYVYAFSVDVDRITAARIGLGGDLLQRAEFRRSPGNSSAAELVAPLDEFLRRVEKTVPDDAICVGSAAAVSAISRGADGGLRLDGAGWLDEALTSVVTGALGAHRSAPLAVRNGADLAALAEHTRGVAVGCDNVIYLHGDAGIGGGFIAGGRPITGHGGHGGEVGHMVVNPQGSRCGCGSRGCWETVVGEQALITAAGRQGHGHALIDAVIDAASRGDADAQLALRQVGSWLGFGVANLVNLFNPELVIFGGTLRGVFLSAAAQVRDKLVRMALPAQREHVRLRTAALGDDATLLGAAELAFEQLLAGPLDTVS